MGSHRKIRNSKLLKHKEWVTVAEAARLLTDSFDEVITEADVLRLALNGKIILSVNFLSGAQGKVCLNNGDEFLEIMKADYPYGIWEKLKFGDDFHPLPGICDLPMLFGGRDIIHQRFRKLHGHSESEFDNEDEILVIWGGQKYKLHKNFEDFPVDLETDKPEDGPWIGPDSFAPLLDLDENCLLVVRTSVLCELEERLAGEDSEELAEEEIEPHTRGGRTDLGGHSGNQLEPRLGRCETPDSKKENLLMGMKEIAEYLGYSVSNVKRLRKLKGFPYNKLSGRIDVLPSELNDWCSKKSKKKK